MPGLGEVPFIGSDQKRAGGVQGHCVIERFKEVMLVAHGQIERSDIRLRTFQWAVADVEQIKQVIMRFIVLPPGAEMKRPPVFTQPPVLLHPFSRGVGKSLSAVEVAEWCELLAPYPVLLVGSADKPITMTWPGNVTDLLGRTTLPELIHLIRQSAWTVSVDSGPMHLAAGLSDRVLSLHTWSNPAMVGPWHPDSWIWRESRLVRVRDLQPDEFPERRDLQQFYGSKERLLAPSDLTYIVAFLRTQLAEISAT